tara:strand:- start:263 stop:454 length:192 start_codon:yes stop_codon:yes gene_type:complete
MKFFDAVDETKRLIHEGHNGVVHLEVIDWNGRRNSVVFKNRVEADNFIKFNADWDVEINEIGR